MIFALREFLLVKSQIGFAAISNLKDMQLTAYHPGQQQETSDHGKITEMVLEILTRPQGHGIESGDALVGLFGIPVLSIRE